MRQELNKEIEDKKLSKIELTRRISFITLLLQVAQFIFYKKEVNMTAEQIRIIIDVAAGVGGALAAGIPALINMIKAKKAAKVAKTNEEKQLAEIDMTNQMKIFIDSAEQLFKQVDIVLKRNGESAGALKKDSVISKLIAYAASKGYAFDEEYWSGKIDDEVAFTRKVNARQ